MNVEFGPKVAKDGDYTRGSEPTSENPKIWAACKDPSADSAAPAIPMRGDRHARRAPSRADSWLQPRLADCHQGAAGPGIRPFHPVTTGPRRPFQARQPGHRKGRLDVDASLVPWL